LQAERSSSPDKERDQRLARKRKKQVENWGRKRIHVGGYIHSLYNEKVDPGKSKKNKKWQDLLEITFKGGLGLGVWFEGKKGHIPTDNKKNYHN